MFNRDNLFVVTHDKTGKYVALPGYGKAYTDCLDEARKFDERWQAERQRGHDESVVSLVRSH